MFVCPLTSNCRITFDTFSKLRKHICKVHDVSLFKSFVCKQGTPPCQRTYSSIKFLYQHIKKRHIDMTTIPSDNVVETEAMCNFNDSVSGEGLCHACDEDSPHVCDEEQVLDFDTNELTFILQLYSEPNINRANVERICHAVENLVHKKFGIEHKMFVNLDTEHCVTRARRKLNLHFEPQPFIVDYIPIQHKKGEDHSVEMQRTSAEMFSLSKTFGSIFSIPHVLRTANDYMSNRHSSILTDVKDGDLLKDLPSNTFPFVLFFDELETGNPLGSKRGIHKLGFVYASLRCFPPHTYSYLDNIYTIAAIPSKAMCSLRNVLANIVEEIDLLEREGIEVNNERIFFRFLGLIGDNLGQHQALGFIESFSANFPCIACKSHRLECQNVTYGSETVLRNSVNYAADLIANDPSSTGINSACVFNNLLNYHVTTNIIYDVMHDVLEGVANIGMRAVISYIIDQQFIGIEALDDLIQSFPYRNLTTKPAHVHNKDLKNNSLTQSASEMKSLVLYFSMIIHEYVPVEDAVWNYYLTLQKMVNILLLKKISRAMVEELEVLISEHHELYKELFHAKLKPKHHHMLHYKSALLQFGPLCHLWAMRFEGKNHNMKVFGQTIRSRVNICKSLLIRDNYRFSLYLLLLRNDQSMDKNDSTGPVIQTSDLSNEICLKWMKHRGHRYEIGSVVATDAEGLIPRFGRIRYIVHKGKTYNCIVAMMTNIRFCSHSSSYIGEFDDSVENFKCLHIEIISKPLVHVVKGGSVYVSSMEF